MKIAIDCRMIGSGGIGTYFESILPYFLNNFDCLLFGDLRLISKYSPEMQQKSNMIQLFDCPVKTFSITELLFFPVNLLKEINNCDLYYSPYCNVPGGIRIPIFTTIHDVVFLDVPGLTSKTGTFIRKCFYQRAINKSTVIFTVSKFSAERINFHLKTGNKPIVITYNSVPPWFTKTSNTQKKEQILFVGNIKKHKGLSTLLSAFKLLIDKNFNGKLLIVGNAENFRSGDESVFEKIKTFPEGSIEFTGKVSDEKLKTLYSESKLLIQPSLYEGFGMPPLEALTMGTNVVLSSIPVFKEIYQNFPVTFFDCENPQDLSEKILCSYNKKSPELLSNIYSFEKTSNIIITTIKKELNK